MKKGGQIAIVILVVLAFAAAAVVVILTGARAGKTQYVCIEVNPKIEMIVDSKEKIKSIKPINQEGKELLIDEDLVGLKVEDAVKKIMTLCGECGYLDLGEDALNGVKVTVLSGLNQFLEATIVEEISGFFVENNIYGLVIEGPEDLQNYKKAKEYGVSAEKYDLAMAVKDNDASQDMEKLVKMSNKKLIDLIEKQHEEYTPEFTQEEIANKSKLIDFNRENYQNHIDSVTDESTREFKSKLEKHIKKHKHDFEIDWENRYSKWVEKE